MLARRLAAAAFLVAVLAAITAPTGAAAQGLDHCDQAAMAPMSIAFLGPAKWATVGSVNVSYHSFGPLGNDTATSEDGETPPPLILIHGFASTQYDWPLAMLQALAQDRQVVIFDNPRIGLSVDTSKDPLTVPYMADVTRGLIKEIGLERPDVIGYSMGGGVALTIATEAPEEIGHVVGVATSFGGPDAPQPPGGLSAALKAMEPAFLFKYLPYMTAPGPAAAPAAPADTTTPAVDPFKLMFPLGSLDPALCTSAGDMNSLAFAALLDPTLYPNAGYAVPSIIPTPAALMATADATAQQHDALMKYFSEPSPVEAGLDDVDKQILYITGVQDDVMPVATQLVASTKTPGAWMVQVPEGGHALPFLNPVEFAGTVTDFLGQASEVTPEQRAYYDKYEKKAVAVEAPAEAPYPAGTDVDEPATPASPATPAAPAPVEPAASGASNKSNGFAALVLAALAALLA